MQAAVLADLRKVIPMFVKNGFRDESIAYALAAGIVILDDQDGEKALRRNRYERRKRNAKVKR